MKDGIIKGTGNSRYLKSAIPAGTTWEQFREMIANGSLPIDLAGINPEGWDQIGDALSKGNLLSDATCDMMGIPRSSVVNTAFQKMAMPYGYYGFNVTTVFEDGAPVPYVELKGLTDFKGNPVFTDENGRCEVAVAETANPTVIISDYIGVVNKEETLVSVEGEVFTPVTVVLERDREIKLLQTSGEYKVVPNIPVDMCIVGGGASGALVVNGSASWDAVVVANGGGGGYVENITNYALKNPVISVSVGAGGAPPSSYYESYASAAGGDTTLVYDENSVVASGAKGQEGNGNGGNGGSAGFDGAVYVFNDETLPRPGGGGAGSKKSSSQTLDAALPGGADFGGAGAVMYNKTYKQGASSGTGPGGGGGGGAWLQSPPNYQHASGCGAGANGGLYIRVNHPTEVSA